MSLPAALQKRRAQLEAGVDAETAADIAAGGEPIQGQQAVEAVAPTTAQVVAPVEVAPTPAPAEPRDVVREDAIRVAQAQARVHEEAIQAAEARAAAAEARRDELAAAEAARVQALELVELDTGLPTDEDLAGYDPQDLKVMQGLSKKEMAPVIKKLMAENASLAARIAQLETLRPTVEATGKAQQAYERKVAEQAEAARYEAVLTPTVPDWKAVVKSAEWKDFLELPADGVNPEVKNGHTLAQYQKSKYTPGVVALFKEFKERSKGTSGAALGDIATPAKTSADRTTAAQPKFLTSDYAVKQKAYMVAKTLTKAEWEAYKVEFNAARLSGRVTDDANILNT